MNRLEKKSLINKNMEIEDDTILSQIKSTIEIKTDDNYWNSFPAALKESIEIGIQESKQGLGRAHEEVIKELRRKYQE